MIKRMISALLVVAMLCSFGVTVAYAENADSTIAIPASSLEKKFVVDGNLDIWYVNEGEEVADDDGNYYQYVALSPIEKRDGVTYYPDPTTFAQAWTAWDDDYVYIYVKIWDDHIIEWDPDGAHAAQNSSAADSVEIWFDPDPMSQTYNFTHDSAGNIIKETLKPNPTDGFYNQTNDPAQGDVQVRLLAYNMMRHDYHNINKPNYGGKTFGEWINDSANFCTFTFENDPITVEETGTKVSEGYGVEARFPRHNDSTGTYRFHIAVNDSTTTDNQYALATGEAWWMRYDTAWSVLYNDNAPFFNQSASQLAKKGVMYTDSVANLNGPGGALVNKIAALGTVTTADKAKVLALQAEYEALSALDQGYVQYKNYDLLEEAIEIVNTPVADPDQEAADAVISLISAIPTTVTLSAKGKVTAARTAYNQLTATQQGKVTNYSKLTAAEATIKALEAAAADQTAADAVIALINAIPTYLVLSDRATVETARDAYDDLTGAQQQLVTNYSRLTTAEQKLIALEAGAADLEAAQVVIDLINAIPTNLALTDKPTVTAARTAYGNLTQTQKDLVSNYSKLTTAEQKLITLEAGAADQAAAKVVENMIAALPTQLTVGDKTEVEAARTAYNGLNDDQKLLVSNFATLQAAEQTIRALEQAAADQTAADKVKTMIDALPATITLDAKDQVRMVRNAYDLLTDAQMDLVINYQVLVDAERTLAELEATGADKEAAELVMALIDAIPDEINIYSKDMLANVRAEYELLNDTQKPLVINYNDLLAAEQIVEALEVEAADKVAAKEVISLIAQLPATITLDKKSMVQTVKEKYDALTETQKGYVTNYQTLADAEATIDRLEDNAADQAVAKALMDKIDALPQPLTLAQKMLVEELLAEFELLTNAQKLLVANYDDLVAAHQTIDRLEQNASDETYANAVMEQIAALPQPITWSAKVDVERAIAAYGSLTDAQKELVKNYDVLQDASNAIVALQQAYEEVVALIAALPDEITLANKQAVDTAVTAYDALPDELAALIADAQKLDDAKQAIQDLTDVAQAVADRIAALPKTITLEHKALVEEIRADYDRLSEEQKGLVENYQTLQTAEQTILDLENPSTVTYGDVDGDGSVSATDALEVLKGVVGKITLTEEQVAAADVDGNGKAEATDALTILKKVVGAISQFPVEA